MEIEENEIENLTEIEEYLYQINTIDYLKTKPVEELLKKLKVQQEKIKKITQQQQDLLKQLRQEKEVEIRLKQELEKTCCKHQKPTEEDTDAEISEDERTYLGKKYKIL